MNFNLAGRLIKHNYYIKGRPLESVNRFCYLGFEVCPSGTVKHAMNTLHDKAKKALRPLMGAIAIKLFRMYVSPIILYNVENWATLTDQKLKKDADLCFFDMTDKDNTDTIHRKFLRYTLGLTKV